jgi:hypothetical protein
MSTYALLAALNKYTNIQIYKYTNIQIYKLFLFTLLELYT